MIGYIIYVREQERDFQQQQKKLNGSTAYIEFIFALFCWKAAASKLNWKRYYE